MRTCVICGASLRGRGTRAEVCGDACHKQRRRRWRARVRRLNQEMPNGKRMRYCTGREMATFGAGYQRIAKMVGPNAMVGSKLNEQQVRKAMRL